MIQSGSRKNLYAGIGMAVLATFIWSGNFIIARAVIYEIPPVSLAFYRWLTASIILLPFAINKFNAEKSSIKRHWKYLFWTALTGVTLFNTLLYVAGHYSPAINLALIGTTSSPVMAIILAAIFLDEKIKPLRIVGVLMCIAGIVLLLSKGSWELLVSFRFSKGDLWTLAAALCFAIYNTLVRRKASAISSINFLFVTFSLGTLLLLPAYIWELTQTTPVVWNGKLMLIILYLGLGASVICFLLWNAAIARLGSATTALFGNLIPVFSSLGAVWLLNEQITTLHILSGSIVITGLVIANIKRSSSG